MALFKFAPSKFEFNIFEPVKLASNRLLLLKFDSINDAPLKLTLIKFALEKLLFSKFPPERSDSYKFALIKEES